MSQCCSSYTQSMLTCSTAGRSPLGCLVESSWNMTAKEIRKSRRRFELIGATICSLCLGSLLWLMSLSSLGPFTKGAWLNLVFYLVASIGCYLSVFWLLDKYFIVAPEGIRPHWIAIALLGTSFSFIVLSLPTWLNYGSRTGLYLVVNIYILSFLSMVMLAIMALVWCLGFTVRLVRNEIDEWRVVLD